MDEQMLDPYSDLSTWAQKLGIKKSVPKTRKQKRKL